MYSCNALKCVSTIATVAQRQVLGSKVVTLAMLNGTEAATEGQLPDYGP